MDTNNEITASYDKTLANLYLNNFRPPIIKIRDEVKPKKIFREVNDFLVGGNLVCLLATDRPSIITDDDSVGEKINKLCLNHKKFWPDLKDNVVSICIKNSTSGDIKLFNVDIHTFICVFSQTKTLINQMNDLADYLSEAWNVRNSPKHMRFTRSESQQILPLDVRCTKVKGSNKTKNIELAIAATTYNFTRDVQNLDSVCNCTPENVYFQLRFQHNDSQAIPGMLSQNLTDWVLLLSDPNLHDFCVKLQKAFPLPDGYVDKIEYYYNIERDLRKTKKKKIDETYIFRKPEQEIESDNSSDVDDVQEPDKKKLKPKE